MVSDTLFEAISQIDDYLKQPSIYEGKEREAVVDLRNRMEAVRIWLDTPLETNREPVSQNETGM